MNDTVHFDCAFCPANVSVNIANQSGLFYRLRCEECGAEWTGEFAADGRFMTECTKKGEVYA